MTGTAESPAHKPEFLSVLYIDYSVGFGGATKSLSLTLGLLPDVRKLMLTSQDHDIVDSWYRGMPVRSLRTLFNYRTIDGLRAYVARGSSQRWIRAAFDKLIALLDVVEAVGNATRILWQWRRHRFHLIHLNNGFVPLEAFLASKILGIPLLVHLRGFLTPREHPSDSTRRQVAWVIAVSDAVADHVHALGVPYERITTIYDPVDVNLFDAAAPERSFVRESWGLSESDIAVGIFGRVIAWKGHREFVQAVLAAMPQNPAIRGVIVGDQSDGALEYYEDVCRLISESPYRDRFVLAGYLEDVEASYHAMDIVVHASIEPEPFGMVVPEGMAARKAVIAAAAGGPLEVVAAGTDGLLVPPGDVTALSRAILELAADPVRRAWMGENGYAKVREGFTIAVSAEQVAGVYQRLGFHAPPVRAESGEGSGA